MKKFKKNAEGRMEYCEAGNKILSSKQETDINLSASSTRENVDISDNLIKIRRKNQWTKRILCLLIVLLVLVVFIEEKKVSDEKRTQSSIENLSATLEQEVFSETTENGKNSDKPDNYMDQYFLPDSNSRYYTDEEVFDWDYITLRNALNKIYARHGFVLNESGMFPELQPLQDHFESCDWYTPIYGKKDDYFTSKFNEFEKANAKLFKDYKGKKLKP